MKFYLCHYRGRGYVSFSILVMVLVVMNMISYYLC